MTVFEATSLRPARRLPLRSASKGAILIGLAAGLLAAIGGVSAAPPPPAAMPVTARVAATEGMDPAKKVPGALTIANIDFKRGDGGAGRLILHFSGNGATPDLRNQGSSVIVNVANAELPLSLQKPLDVVDFATPVQKVNANRAGSGTQIILNTRGPYQSLAYQTGNDYIVEIVPRAAAPATAAASTGTAAMGATVSANAARAYTGHPVTFNFQDVPVRTVLQLIAEESNLNIVASDTVQGNVTLRLINVPWDQALDIVLQAKGLDKRRSGSVVWIAPQSEIAKYEQDREDARIAIENRAEMITEYIPISYGNAEDLAKLLTDDAKSGTSGGAGGAAQGRGFLSPRGSISFDRRTNTLLVIDIPQRVQSVKDLVHLLDKPVDQVVIEARIVIANESFARELGSKFGLTGTQGATTYGNSIANNIENQNASTNAALANFTAQQAYQAALTNYNTCLGGGGANCVAPTVPTPVLPSIIRGLMSNLPAAAPAGSLALSILNAGYALDIELSALQTEGRGEVISNPRIVTSNQKEAVIRQGSEVGYLTTTGGQSGTVPTVAFKEALLELKVTPTITADGRVFLNMNVKKDEVAGFVDTGAGQVPTLARREVNTAVLMEDGQTVVIGGVYEFKDNKDMSKIPFLADLPVIGNLFKKTTRGKSKAELLVFVTPKVLRVAQR